MRTLRTRSRQLWLCHMAVLTKAALSHITPQLTTGGCAFAHLHPGPLLPASANPPFPDSADLGAAWMPRELPETMHAGHNGRAMRFGRRSWPPPPHAVALCTVAASRRGCRPRWPWDLQGAQDSAAGQVVGEGRPGLPGQCLRPKSIRSSLSAEPPSVGWSWALAFLEYTGGRSVTRQLSAWL